MKQPRRLVEPQRAVSAPGKYKPSRRFSQAIYRQGIGAAKRLHENYVRSTTRPRWRWRRT